MYTYKYTQCMYFITVAGICTTIVFKAANLVYNRNNIPSFAKSHEPIKQAKRPSRSNIRPFKLEWKRHFQETLCP